MNQFFEFLSGLFATDKWPAHWQSGYWSDFHGWIYVISDLTIWTAYFLILYYIFNYLRKWRENLLYSRTFFLFASFTLLCGSTYLLDAIMFWLPAYRLNALVRLATGIVSLVTVYYLVKLLPEFFSQEKYSALIVEIERRKDAERKLAVANADLEKFAYVASHDLQDPLRKMIVFNQMLEQRNRDKFDDRSRELIEKTIRSSNRMQTLITDVLSLSKLTQDVILEPVNLNDVLDLAIADMEGKISEKNASITVDPLPVVLGNSNYLQQMFYNLIGNALKFTYNQPEIHIGSTVTGKFALITVKDNGIGIEQEFFEKIFLPFQRLNSNAEFDGSGIGLSLCKKIAQIHGGEISVDSQTGKGSTFMVKLMLATTTIN